MAFIKSAITHFLEFHKGLVNIAAHIVGFAGIFYSIYNLNWVLFAVFLMVLEFGHVYNHLAGIKRYDFRAKVFFWRITIFLLLVVIFFLVRNKLV